MNWIQDRKAWTCEAASLRFRVYPDYDIWCWHVYNGRDQVDDGTTTSAENAKEESEDAIRTLARVLNAALEEMQ